jgi:hypothetical protein
MSVAVPYLDRCTSQAAIAFKNSHELFTAQMHLKLCLLIEGMLIIVICVTNEQTYIIATLLSIIYVKDRNLHN